MKSIIYQKFDLNCKFCIETKISYIFRGCINPVIFLDFGEKERWIVNCNGCVHKNDDFSKFDSKLELLKRKLESELSETV